MDWKYKHFQNGRMYRAAREVVLEAARRFMSEALGWKVEETADGFIAEGYSFSHAAIANFRFASTGQETELVIDLRVARAGGAGFMLFDVGGYYNIQIRKWLDAIQLAIHQNLTGAAAEPPFVPAPANKTTACLFNGCLAFIIVVFGVWLLVTLVCAVVGLVTGTLYLWGRNGTLIVHGLPARIISAGILLFGAFVVWRVMGSRRQKAESGRQ